MRHLSIQNVSFTAPMTVLELLNGGAQFLKEKGVADARLDAELLLAHSLRLTREALYLHLRADVTDEEQLKFRELIARRASREPLAYIIGRKEFWSIDLGVNRSVLIPRPDTELLVEEALYAMADRHGDGPHFVLDLGTGSGAISIALARERPDLFIVATDISEQALTVARENARRAGVLDRIAFVAGDLFLPLRRRAACGRFTLVVSNPPYIPDSQIAVLAEEIKNYEPRMALSGGIDGLKFHLAVISEAALYLSPGGWLLLEVGDSQAVPVSDWIAKQPGFSKPECIRDLSGVERVVKARKE